MGLGRHGEGARYIKVANGRLHAQVNGQDETYDWFEGTLRGIRSIEDEYEGQATVKVELEMEDEKGQRYIIKFTQDSWYGYGFFARLPRIDVAKPFRLGAMPSEENPKITFCFMRQGGQKIEPDKENTPRPEKVKHGKKETTDWSGFSEYAENVVLETAIKLGVPAENYAGSMPPPDDADYATDEALF